MAPPYCVTRDFREATRRHGRAISGQLANGRAARRGTRRITPPPHGFMRGASRGAREHYVMNVVVPQNNSAAVANLVRVELAHDIRCSGRQY